MRDQGIEKTPEAAVALMRMVDFKIPLVWLLGGFASAVMLLASMYYQLQEVSRGMAALQISVNAGNNQSVTLAGEIALIKFRMEHVEADLARTKGGKQ
jgi:hypothetical protein